MNKNIKKNIKKYYKVLGILIAIIIVFFFIKSFISNWSAIKGYLITINVRLFIVSLIIYAAVFFLTGWNWTTMIENFNGGVNKKKYIHFFLYSSLARYIPGGIWNIAGRVYLCEKDGMRKGATAFSIVFEHVFQIMSSGVFLILLIANEKLFGSYTGIGVILGTISVIIFPFFIKKVVFHFLNSKDIVDSALCEVFTFRFYLRYMIRYCGVWLLTGISIICLVFSFLSIDLSQMKILALSYPVSWVIGFLSPTPNGMGTKEGMMIFFLRNHFPMELLIMLTMFIRIWTMVGEILILVIYEIYYFVGKHRKKL